MDKDKLLTLPNGTILHHKSLRNADSTPLRARINGKPRFWKRQPGYFELPMKHGLRHHFYITPENIGEWELP